MPEESYRLQNISIESFKRENKLSSSSSSTNRLLVSLSDWSGCWRYDVLTGFGHRIHTLPAYTLPREYATNGWQLTTKKRKLHLKRLSSCPLFRHCRDNRLCTGLNVPSHANLTNCGSIRYIIAAAAFIEQDIFDRQQTHSYPFALKWLRSAAFNSSRLI